MSTKQAEGAGRWGGVEGGWSGDAVTWVGQRPYIRDDALLFIAYVMLIWAPHIKGTRWICSQSPADTDSKDH